MASVEERTLEGREVVEEKVEVKEASSSSSAGGKREREEEEEEESVGGKEKLKVDQIGGVVEEVKGPEQVKRL